MKELRVRDGSERMELSVDGPFLVEDEHGYHCFWWERRALAHARVYVDEVEGDWWVLLHTTDNGAYTPAAFFAIHGRNKRA